MTAVSQISAVAQNAELIEKLARAVYGGTGGRTARFNARLEAVSATFADLRCLFESPSKPDTSGLSVANVELIESAIRQATRT